MSSITFSGLGSGMDYATWVEELIAAKKAETVTPLEEKKKEYENSKSALDIVKGYFGEFEDSIETFTNITEFSSNDIFNQKSASADFDEYLKVNCTNESTVSDYYIQILQRATSTVMKSEFSAAMVADGATEFGDVQQAKSGSFTIIADGVTEVFAIEEDDTLQEIADKFNAKFSDKLTATYELDGTFKIVNKNDSVLIIGSNTDTSNFKSIMKIEGVPVLDASGNKIYQSLSPIYNANSKGTLAGPSATANLTDVINEGTIKINGVEFTIDSTTTIDSLVRAINSNQNVGVKAFFDQNAGSFNLTSIATGSRAILIEDTGSTNFFNTMNLNYDEGSTIPGKDAKISINGAIKVSSSNTITDTGYTGLTLELLDQPDPDLTITASVTNDSSGLEKAIETFVSKYNQVVAAIKEATASDGYLEYDSTLRTIYREMRSIVSGVYNTGLDFSMLSDIGISTGAAGLSATDSATNLVFDKAKLTEMLEKYQMNDIKKLFVNDTDNASFDLLDTKVSQALDPTTGFFQAKATTLNNLITSQTKRIDNANQQLLTYEERLTAQFQAMDKAIAEMNNQYSGFLDSLSQLTGA